MSDEEDGSISEINILPDGRVCLFGASQQVLEILEAIPLGDAALRTRIDRLRTADVPQTMERNRGGSDHDDGAIENRARL